MAKYAILHSTREFRIPLDTDDMREEFEGKEITEEAIEGWLMRDPEIPGSIEQEFPMEYIGMRCMDIVED